MRKGAAILFCLAFLPATPALSQDAVEGEALFATHCAVCHGAGATGGGPMAPVLLIQPTDLTTLAAQADGTFPLIRVVTRIDGRDPLVSHGSPMPVYGPYFEGDADVALRSPGGQQIMTSRPVADLVAWLASVQQ